jgi:hypothetical protein
MQKTICERRIQGPLGWQDTLTSNAPDTTLDRILDNSVFKDRYCNHYPEGKATCKEVHKKLVQTIKSELGSTQAQAELIEIRSNSPLWTQRHLSPL